MNDNGAELARIRKLLQAILVCLILLLIGLFGSGLFPIAVLAVLIYLPCAALYRWSKTPTRRPIR